MTLGYEEILDTLAAIEYKDGWDFTLGLTSFRVPAFISVFFLLADGTTVHCRKWSLESIHTVSDLVRTAFAAILAAEEHEAREAFLYRGAAIFHPHFDVDDIVLGIQSGTLGGS